MVAIEDGPYQQALARFGRENRPAALVVVSAHWESGAQVRVTSAQRHHVIHDFGGFPDTLFELGYEAPGEPALARRVAEAVTGAGIVASLDGARGLDHGVWIPLRLMYPDARIPVVAVSLPDALDPRTLMRMGESLRPVLADGVLLMGSGGLVHNLRRLDWRNRDRPPEPWAEAFDSWVHERLGKADYAPLAGYRDTAPNAALAVPTAEHFDPLFVVMGAAEEGARPVPIYEGFQHGTLSMRSFALRAVIHGLGQDPVAALDRRGTIELPR